MGHSKYRIESRHHTKGNALRAIERLKKKQARQPESERDLYKAEPEICTGAAGRRQETGLWVVWQFRVAG